MEIYCKMKNRFTFLVGLIVLAVLILFMVTFQVRYDEIGVVTTFGEARKPIYDDTGKLIDEGSLKFEPGIYFRAPFPIQRVRKYSTKLRILEDQLEEIRTADNSAVIMKTYLAWKVSEPHLFFTAQRDIKTAEQRLKQLMRNLRGLISQYRFNQLVNENSNQLRLKEIEEKCKVQLGEELAELDNGIEVVRVGIVRTMLPEEVTEKVFERMRQTQERYAAEAREEGKAEAMNIVDKAENAQKQILAFAKVRAQKIKDIGNQEAAQYVEPLRVDEDFAIALRKIQFFKETLANRTTFILKAGRGGLFGPLLGDWLSDESDDRRLGRSAD